MNPETILLINALAPLATQIIITGAKVAVTFKEDLTADQLIEALQKSKSAAWPELDFGQK